MGDFKSASTWVKLAMLMISLAFSLHLFSMDGSGYGTTTSYLCGSAGYSGDGNNGGGNGNGGNGNQCQLAASRAVQAMEIIGFLAILSATFLVLCLVHLDELNGNKIVKIIVIVTSLLGGLFVIIGIAIFEASVAKYPITSSVAVMSGLSALLGGIFTILDIVGVNAPAAKA